MSATDNAINAISQVTMTGIVAGTSMKVIDKTTRFMQPPQKPKRKIQKRRRKK